MLGVQVTHWHLENMKRPQAGALQDFQVTVEVIQLDCLPVKPAPHVQRLNGVSQTQQFTNEDCVSSPPLTRTARAAGGPKV